MTPSVRTPAAPVPGAADAPGPTIEESRRGPWRIVARVAIVVMLVGIAVMWGFVFFGSYTPPGRLADQTFPKAAEPICAAGQARLNALPPAFQASSANDRADVIVRGSDELDRMLTELRGVVPPGAASDGIRTWLDDWERYVLDRREYADQLRHDPNARFSVTQSDRDKAQVTKAVDNFATVNDMPSCVTPLDLGG